MNRGNRLDWRAVRVGVDGASRPGSAFERGRLAALQRWQSGGAPVDASFFDPVEGFALTDPREVDWSTFPELEALQAVIEDELRRFHSALHGAERRGGRAEA